MATTAAATTTEYPRIVRRSGVCGGSPTVEGTALPVWLLVRFWQDGARKGELLAMCSALTPAGLHSALAYYWDHKGEIDREIEANRVETAIARLRADPEWVEEQAGTFRRAPWGADVPWRCTQQSLNTRTRSRSATEPLTGHVVRDQAASGRRRRPAGGPALARPPA